jgi:hypothetical protein
LRRKVGRLDVPAAFGIVIRIPAGDSLAAGHVHGGKQGRATRNVGCMPAAAHV